VREILNFELEEKKREMPDFEREDGLYAAKVATLDVFPEFNIDNLLPALANLKEPAKPNLA